MPHAAYRGSWPTVRRAILERDGHRCQIGGPKCTRTATCVDHITPVSQGGDWWDPANLRAACRWCNNWRAHPPARRPAHAPSRRW